MKKFSQKIISALVSLALVFAIIPLQGYTEGNIVITEAGGYFEGAYVEWTGGDGPGNTNVYIKSGDTEYTKLDDELIREYPGYYRADIPGISAGEYTLKIVPINDGTENEALSVETEAIQVNPYTREGFAFSAESPAGEANGGYTSDGTPKVDADIIYVSNGNKDRVMIDGIPKCGVGLVSIFDYRERNKIDTPLIVRLIGRVDMPERMQKYLLGIRYTKNVTIEGIGEDAAVHGWGFTLKESQNIELRNFAIMWFGGGTDSDAVAIDTNNDNVWIHNLDFFYGAHGPDDDQSKGDGCIDMKNQSDYVTISYNHFWDTGKSTFTDSPVDKKTHVTYHHNWFDHSDSRHPRCVGSDVHMYNNYYDGVSKYGIGAAEASSIFAESNYFRYCGRPMIISSQGSDVYNKGKYNGKGTLSGQDGGMIKGYGNRIDEYDRFYTQLDTPDDTPDVDDAGQFDCYVVEAKDEQVPSTIKAKKGGATYDNFDTAESMYEYTPHTADEVEAVVTQYAGRINGGDFEWDFDDSIEDKNYEVITGLQEKVENYTPAIVEVGGDASLIVEQPPEPSEYRITHNFTTQGTESDFYTISGKLTNLFGIMRYDAVNLTEALKFEGSSQISFTPTMNGILTLVANPYRGSVSIKINGTEFNGDSETGLIRFNVEAGVPYTITRSSVSYLFYMVLEYDENSPVITSAPSTPKPTTAPAATAEPGVSTSPKPPTDTNADRLVHNFTESNTTSDFFEISGSTSKEKGTIVYDGLSLSNCLKLGSSAKIGFTSPRNGKMTIVFGSSSTPTAKINGEAMTGNGNVLTFDVVADTSYSITKNSGEQMIYYILLDLEKVEEPEVNLYPYVISNVEMTDNGVDISVKCLMPENNAQIIVAVYDSIGKLTEIEILKAPSEAGETIIPTSINDEFAKVFIWDISAMKPLAESHILQL